MPRTGYSKILKVLVQGTTAFENQNVKMQRSIAMAILLHDPTQNINFDVWCGTWRSVFLVSVCNI